MGVSGEMALKTRNEMPTVNELGRKHAKRTEQTFTVDAKFLRDEARDAIRSYFMPFAGIYAAVVGKDVRVVNARDSELRTSHSKKSGGNSSRRGSSR